MFVVILLSVRKRNSNNFLEGLSFYFPAAKKNEKINPYNFNSCLDHGVRITFISINLDEQRGESGIGTSFSALDDGFGSDS